MAINIDANFAQDESVFTNGQVTLDPVIGRAILKHKKSIGNEVLISSDEITKYSEVYAKHLVNEIRHRFGDPMPDIDRLNPETGRIVYYSSGRASSIGIDSLGYSSIDKNSKFVRSVKTGNSFKSR